MKEALKLALEALKTIDEAMPFPVAKLAQAAIKEALAQPDAFEQGRQEGMKQERALRELSRLGQEIEAAEPVAFAGVKVWVGNQQVVQYVTQTELRYETQFWLHMMLNAEKCIAALKEITHD
jgi:hypothetical protein